MTTIEIINPMAGKGYKDRELLYRDEVLDEANYIDVAAVVRDDAGEEVRDAKVEISATDASQNKTYEGTGNKQPIFVDNPDPKREDKVKKIVPVYPFRYEIRKKGKHTITFKVGAVTASISITPAKKDDRPKPERVADEPPKEPKKQKHQPK